MISKEKGSSGSHERSSETIPHHTAQHAPSGRARALPQASSGEQLGSGVITSILGRGGAALVYEIYCERLGIYRAVKLLKPTLPSTAHEKFDAEMRVAAQLRHHNIVTIHTVGDWNRIPYIEMEKIDGSSMEKLLSERGRVPLPLIAAIGIQVCRALEFMHNHEYVDGGHRCRGVLHRDLKPANILIDQNGTVKLTDFGVASSPSAEGSSDFFEGSLQYAAPEFLKEAPADLRSDVFSLGAVLYEMATGERTFPAKNPKQLVPDRLSNSYTPLKEHKLSLPKSFRSMVEQCLDADPEKRPNDAKAVRKVLESILVKYEERDPETLLKKCLAGRRCPRKKHSVTPLVTGAVSVLLLGTGILLWHFGGNEVEESQTAPTFRVSNAETTELPVSPEIAPSSSSEGQRGRNRQNQTSAESGTNAAKPPRISRREEPQQRSTRSPRSVPASFSRTPTKRIEEKKSYLQELIEKHGTDNLITITEKEFRAGKLDNALRVIDSMPAGMQNSTRVTLLELRALKRHGDSDRLRQFFANATSNDAEFLLEKARYLYGTGNLSEALGTVQRVARSFSELGDKESINRSAALLKARILTRLYRNDQQEATRKKALDAWFQVKFLLRTNQSDPQFAYANEQIRHLSETTGN